MFERPEERARLLYGGGLLVITIILALLPGGPLLADAAQIARPSPQDANSATPTASPQPAAPTTNAEAVTRPFQISGDFRLRYEGNFGDQDASDRQRGVLRARTRLTYEASPWLAVGGMLATGDPNDPNSTDVTLSNFDDKVTASLDQAYVRATFGRLQIHGGKVPQPFIRTELVWDGDVSPQGISVSYRLPLREGATVRATGLGFLVDESAAGPDSNMIGGQLSLETSPRRPLKLEAAIALFDYSLGSTAGGDSGDFRSNLFMNGRYVSDFNLLDTIVALGWKGSKETWPVRMVGEYVKNLGAATPEDSGFGLDLVAGRGAKQGEWRLTLGYASAEADSVFAAFSHDNTAIASNYVQKSLSADYLVRPKVLLNATFYRYKPRSAMHAGINDPTDWLNRLRLNLLVNF